MTIHAHDCNPGSCATTVRFNFYQHARKPMTVTIFRRFRALGHQLHSRVIPAEAASFSRRRAGIFTCIGFEQVVEVRYFSARLRSRIIVARSALGFPGRRRRGSVRIKPDSRGPVPRTQGSANSESAYSQRVATSVEFLQRRSPLSDGSWALCHGCPV